MFHGAFNRQTREYPVFLGFRNEAHRHAHQLSVSDPSLALPEKLSTGWFAGSRGTPLQSLLPQFIADLATQHAVDKLIFIGGSAGGFAALYYSGRFPGSTAIVSAPQTNVHAYYAQSRDAYLKAAWPDLESSGDAMGGPCLDLREMYREGMTNTVIYLQSSLDLFHVEKQMAPFLAALPQSSFGKFILQCTFWGQVGHSNAIPISEVNAWIRAVLSVDEGTSESISMAYHLTSARVSQASIPPKPTRGASASPGASNSVDLQWTKKIAAEMLTQGTNL